MKKDKPKIDSFFIIAFMVMFLFILIVGAYALHFSPHLPQWTQSFFSSASNDPADWGTFGDYVGGMLNPIFGFFGFMTLIITVRFQRQQLDDQRQAMQQQQEDMEAQRESLAISNKTQIKQQFESTFFTLLKKLEDHQKYLAQTYDNAFDEAESFFMKDTVFSELDDYQPTSNEEVIESLYISLLLKELPFYIYLKIIKKILILINELNYPYLHHEAVKDKNFYIDLLLLDIPQSIVLIFSIEPFYKEERHSKLIINDHILLKMIENNGFLRTLTFTPLDTKPILGDANWSNANNPVTKALHAYYNLSAFKPIEVPPTNT